MSYRFKKEKSDKLTAKSAKKARRPQSKTQIVNVQSIIQPVKIEPRYCPECGYPLQLSNCCHLECTGPVCEYSEPI